MSSAAITRRLENDLSLPHALPQAAPLASPIRRARPQRHPPALWLLSLAEGCERFGFYGMLSIFTLFLNEHLGFSEQRAADWYGIYLAGVYALPLVGGAVASRFHSTRSCVQVGVFAMAAGYFILGTSRVWITSLALALLIVGNGLFKPNINVLVGNLYEPRDNRRDEAFGIFYLAINAGGFAGPLASELIRSRFGWFAVFAFAGLALLLAAILLLMGRRMLTETGQARMLAPPPVTSGHRRMVALLLISIALIPFWAAYHQHGSSLTFWARDGIDRAIRWGSLTEIPPGWFASASAGFVLALTPAVAALGRRLRPSPIGQMIAGVVMGAASFGILWLGTRENRAALVHPAWLLGHYLFMTIAELLLAPVGLSLISRLAPARWSGVLFGLWYISTAVGDWLSGSVVRLWVRWPHDRFFGFLTLLLLATAALLCMQYAWLRHALNEDNR